VAVLGNQQGFVGQEVSQENILLPAQSSERLAF
jgi:hypothetical protein